MKTKVIASLLLVSLLLIALVIPVSLKAKATSLDKTGIANASGDEPADFSGETTELPDETAEKEKVKEKEEPIAANADLGNEPNDFDPGADGSSSSKTINVVLDEEDAASSEPSASSKPQSDFNITIAKGSVDPFTLATEFVISRKQRVR
ncbi:MAG: hypothetical protein LBT59_29815 [Clostridiales bacterium]|jgi:hypothetical protein|nr:hypothetical protein [Clostridiales bacterium]